MYNDIEFNFDRETKLNVSVVVLTRMTFRVDDRFLRLLDSVIRSCLTPEYISQIRDSKGQFIELGNYIS